MQGVIGEEDVTLHVWLRMALRSAIDDGKLKTCIVRGPCPPDSYSFRGRHSHSTAPWALRTCISVPAYLRGEQGCSVFPGAGIAC